VLNNYAANAEVATVLGSIPASSATLNLSEHEKYMKNKKNPCLGFLMLYMAQNSKTALQWIILSLTRKLVKLNIQY
jgi:hypothetical protein